MSNEPFSDQIQSALSLHAEGKLAEAASVYETILGQAPQHADALHLLGILLHQTGRSAEGLERIAAAVQLQPAHPAFLYNLGVILQELNRAPEAEAAYRNCLSLDPAHSSAWVNLGNLLADHGVFGEAIDCQRNALRLQPDLAEHHARLARCLRLAGDIEGTLAHLGRAVALDPGNEIAHSALLFVSQYEPGITLPELHRRHEAWASRFPLPKALPAPPPAPPPAPDRPLRVGFLSPDLGNHPVGIFMAPLLERLSPAAESGIETVCFSDSKKADEFTSRNRGLAAEWHEVFGLNDDDLEARLRAARLDVLIELAGHTDNNRLPLLARKPVAVQVSWAGYTGTTGLGAIDYLMTDAHHSPDGAESHYAETLLRFPFDYIPYEPPVYAPDVSPLPMSRTGHPTFGCLNNPTKLTTATIALWTSVLRAVPDARLLLKYKGMTDPAVRNRVLGLFRARGVSPDRITLLDGTTHGEHLATFGHIDVALDPVPYSGGLSTCEAVWMGVPVVTLPGDTFASRHSLSHLHNAGLTGTVARDEDDYVRIAVELVSHPDTLAARRSAMRETVRQSPLCDLDGFARDFVSAMRAISDQ